jgi:hypothetical protein
MKYQFNVNATLVLLSLFCTTFYLSCSSDNERPDKQVYFEGKWLFDTGHAAENSADWDKYGPYNYVLVITGSKFTLYFISQSGFGSSTKYDYIFKEDHFLLSGIEEPYHILALEENVLEFLDIDNIPLRFLRNDDAVDLLLEEYF